MEEEKRLYVRKASAGSGKTYTLAAHYVALLLHGESYRSILAVTFTNKATAEMKERILTYLYQIARETHAASTQGFLSRVRTIYKELYGECRVQSAECKVQSAECKVQSAECKVQSAKWGRDIELDEYCAKEAERIFGEILSDYDGMRVSTIDAFLQSLLAGMVQMLGGAVGYQVELDTEGVISDAVDQLLTVGAQEKSVRTRITNYMMARMAEDKSWDVRRGLRNIGRELYRELLQEKEGQLLMNEQRLKDFKEQIKWQKHAPVEELKKVMEKVDVSVKTNEKVVNRMKDSLAGEKDADYAFKGYTDNELAKVKPDSPEMQMHLLADQCRKAYLRDKFCTRHLEDLVLMESLKSLIEEILRESNTRLLGVTANTLAKALQPGDADFVLEKVGIRYRHIMLDEFQDTSSLQWTNFSKILKEILSTESGSTLIVGDIKQSIYRWRNGDWEIMAGLENQWGDYYNQDVPELSMNFRSEKEVVRFNLETMRRLSAEEADEQIASIYKEGFTGENIDQYYRKDHPNGYVQYKAYHPQSGKSEDRNITRDEMTRDMFRTIVRLHENGVKWSDMMILVRRNKEAAEILRVMGEMGLTLPIVSGDCFELEQSQSVQTIVAGMRSLYAEDGIAREILRTAHPEIEPTRVITPAMKQLSLIDLTETLCRLYLSDEHGVMNVSDMAYVNSFKDKVRQFAGTNGSDGKRFLSYWDDKLRNKAIPTAETDGIRMMTIHASKGLEAKNVFVPYCDWKMEEDKGGSQLWCEVDELPVDAGKKAILPIQQTKNMLAAGFEKEYKREHQLQRVDNLNLAYVAFTRAAERLYIYSDVTEYRDKKGVIKNYRELDVAQLMHYLYGDNACFGTEFWERKEEKKESAPVLPFSFGDALVEPAVSYSSEEHIEFQQSQDSRKYGWNIASLEPESDEMSRRVFGTICHDVLATIGLYPNGESAVAAARAAVKDAYQKGVIPTEALRKEIEPLIVDTVSTLEKWFAGEWRVQREEAVVFLDEHGEPEERRMDRVMWRGKQAIVLDYKFGHDDPSYDRQVRHYMQICRQMGATDVHGYLWIAAERKCVEVV